MEHQEAKDTELNTFKLEWESQLHKVVSDLYNSTSTHTPYTHQPRHTKIINYRKKPTWHKYFTDTGLAEHLKFLIMIYIYSYIAN